MKKATFTSAEPDRKITHWQHRTNSYVMWRADSRWNRVYGNSGVVDDNNRISITPLSEPHSFIPCYGDLVITISAQD